MPGKDTGNTQPEDLTEDLPPEELVDIHRLLGLDVEEKEEEVSDDGSSGTSH